MIGICTSSLSVKKKDLLHAFSVSDSLPDVTKLEVCLERSKSKAKD